MLVIHIHSDYTHAQCLVIGIQTEHYLNKMNIDVCSTVSQQTSTDINHLIQTYVGVRQTN